MLGRPQILSLIPQKGSMCLLDEALSWTEEEILCRARSHLDPENPLRRAGRIAGLAGIEYALQAMALHGALLAGGALAPGLLARLFEARISAPHLDDPAFGALKVRASLERSETSGIIYQFSVSSEPGQELISGTATILKSPPLPAARAARAP